MIGIWVEHELSYDKHFPNADRIFRIENVLITDGVPKTMAGADPRLTDKVRGAYPGVQSIARVLNVPTLVSYGGKNAYDPNALFVDTTFFDVFAFTFVKGNAAGALRKGTIVITETIAKALFGAANPIGQTLYFNNIKTKGDSVPRVVTGVIRDNDAKSHFHPTVIIPRNRGMESFEQTYAMFKPDYTPQDFRKKIWDPLYKSYFRREYAEEDKQDIGLNITPLTKIHLTPNTWGDLEVNGNRSAVYILSVVAFFILVIASINYTNLATAASFSRAREIGIRKLLGATRRQVVAQFLTESVVIAFFAAIVGLALAEMMLPVFSKLAGKQFTVQLFSIRTIGLTFALAAVVGCLSGLYPAFYVSSFSTVKALRETASTGKLTLRKILVIVQFGLSYIALTATVIAARQMDYIKTKNLGFNKDNIVVVNLNDPALKEKTEIIKDVLKKHPHVLAVSASYNTPGEDPAHSYLEYETPQGMKSALINAIWADHDYLKLLDLKLIEGDGFDSSMLPKTDTTIFAVMSESAVKRFNWTNAVGKKVQSGMTYGFRKGRVVGVVKDFHITSLHDTITPMYLQIPRQHNSYVKYNYLSLRIGGGDTTGVLKYVRQVYKSFSKQYPFEYFFLDERINKQYEKEKQQGILFNWFAGISIFISCLGLLSLVSFSMKQRDKEIAIRKISGATVPGIILLLSRDFMRLVLIAVIVATPVAYYAMDKWLQNFAYHTSIGWITFFIAGLFAIVIALATVSIHTVRAANKDPAPVLRHE
jgi:putative ABC transport system permease protein